MNGLTEQRVVVVGLGGSEQTMTPSPAGAVLDIDALQPGFTYLVLQKLDPATNARRFYYLAWQPTTLGWAVVRAYGRIGVRCRLLAPIPFASLADAWPLIRQLLRTRFRHGYYLANAVEAAPVLGFLQDDTAEVITSAPGT